MHPLIVHGTGVQQQLQLIATKGWEMYFGHKYFPSIQGRVLCKRTTPFVACANHLPVVWTNLPVLWPCSKSWLLLHLHACMSYTA